MDKLLEKLLEQSPIAITLGLTLYALYSAYIDQIKYNREQDKHIAEIMSKLIPVVEGMKFIAQDTTTKLDRNLTQFDSGTAKNADKLDRLILSCSNLEAALNMFTTNLNRK